MWGDSGLTQACGVLGKIMPVFPRLPILKMKSWFTWRKGNSTPALILKFQFSDITCFPSPSAIPRECRKHKQLQLSAYFDFKWIFLLFAISKRNPGLLPEEDLNCQPLDTPSSSHASLLSRELAPNLRNVPIYHDCHGRSNTRSLLAALTRFTDETQHQKFETPLLLKEKDRFSSVPRIQGFQNKRKRKIHETAQVPGDNNSRWSFFQFISFSLSHSYTALLPKAYPKQQSD